MSSTDAIPTMVVNQRASAAIRSLAAAMENAGTPADALRGITTVEAREDLASAADLVQQIAVAFNGLDWTVTQAAIRVYYILMDQAGRTLVLCPSCLFSTPPEEPPQRPGHGRRGPRSGDQQPVPVQLSAWEVLTRIW